VARGGGSAAESVNLYEAPVLGFYRAVASVFWGGLIQELAGTFGGSGGWLTKRSGWAAKPASGSSGGCSRCQRTERATGSSAGAGHQPRPG
jgi:hypothetical protein